MVFPLLWEREVSLVKGQGVMKTPPLLILLCTLICAQTDCSDPIKVAARRGGEAVLPCSSLDKFSLTNNYFSWQMGNKVSYSFVDGKPREEDIIPQYRGRTDTPGSVKRGNLSLRIRTLTPRDEGTYKCYLFTHVPDTKKIQECTVHLGITADFSTPVILTPEQGTIRLGEEVNLTCLSSGGYPRPQVNWTDGEGRSLPAGASEGELWQDPGSGLWNVSSVLQVKAERNSSYTCSILNPGTGESRRSDPWTGPVPATKIPHLSQGDRAVNVTVTSVVVICLIAAFIGVGFWIKSRRKYRGVPNREQVEDGERSDRDMKAV